MRIDSPLFEPNTTQNLVTISPWVQKGENGGGENRTRVQEVSTLAFYMFSDIFNLTKHTLSHEMVHSDPLSFICMHEKIHTN